MKEQLANYTTRRAKQNTNNLTWILYYSGAINYYFDALKGSWQTYFRYWHPLFYVYILLIILYNMHDSFRESISDIKSLFKENKVPKEVKYTYLKCLKAERILEEHENS